MGDRDTQAVIDVTRRWVAGMVVGLNLCPFARRVPDAGLIRYAVTDAGDHEELLAALEAELVALPPRKSAWAWSASSAALYPVPFAAPLSSSMTSWTFEADFALCASITSRNPFTRS